MAISASGERSGAQTHMYNALGARPPRAERYTYRLGGDFKYSDGQNDHPHALKSQQFTKHCIRIWGAKERGATTEMSISLLMLRNSFGLKLFFNS